MADIQDRIINYQYAIIIKAIYYSVRRRMVKFQIGRLGLNYVVCYEHNKFWQNLDRV